MTLRVMAYNIHHGADAQGRVDLQRIAETILIYEPDILFLSEVDQYWRRSGLVDQPEYLAKATRMPYSHFAPALETRSPMVTVLGRSARYGNLILSKVPFLKTGFASLPRRGRNEPRNVLWVDVEAGGRRIRLFGTHLSVDSRGARRAVASLGRAHRSLSPPVPHCR